MLFDDAIEFLLLVDRQGGKTMSRVAKVLSLLMIREIGQEKEMRQETNQFGRVREFVDGDLLLLLTRSIPAEDRRTFDAEEKEIRVEQPNGQGVLVGAVAFPECAMI